MFKVNKTPQRRQWRSFGERLLKELKFKRK